jgi:hypothetical protein
LGEETTRQSAKSEFIVLYEPLSTPLFQPFELYTPHSSSTDRPLESYGTV